MRGVDDGGERVLGLAHFAPGAAHLLPADLERLGHLIEVLGQRPDLVPGAHRGSMAEIAARQHRRVLPELPQRPHDMSRQQPCDRDDQHQRADDDQGAPFQAGGQRRIGDVRGHPDRDQPGDAASGGKAIHAFHIVPMGPA
jgi:hypothetical protein